MALIGFVLCVIVGVALILLAFGIFAGCRMFGGKVEWFPVVLFGGIGSAALYYAVAHAPFVITMAGK